jgi:hypothetical protein
MGARFEIQHLPRDFINLYSNHEPKMVDFEDPKIHEKVVEFYEMLETKFKELGVFHFFIELFRIVEGEIYQHINGHYYLIKTKLPGMNWHYVEG